MENSTLRLIITYSIFLDIFLLVYLMGRTPFLSFKIGNIAPFLLLSALMALCMFFNEWYGFIFGIVCGILKDCSAVGTGCFNTIALMLIGAVAGFVASRFLNKNFKAAAMLTFVAAILYFALHFTASVLFSAEVNKLGYFLTISLPSAVYSTLFIIPFYFLFKFLYKRLSAEN